MSHGAGNAVRGGIESASVLYSIVMAYNIEVKLRIMYDESPFFLHKYCARHCCARAAAIHAIIVYCIRNYMYITFTT